jgi:hypothetical protein
MDEAESWPPADERHGEHVDDELGAHVVIQRPADDAARVEVLDGGQVEEALRVLR